MYFYYGNCSLKNSWPNKMVCISALVVQIPNSADLNLFILNWETRCGSSRKMHGTFFSNKSHSCHPVEQAVHIPTQSRQANHQATKYVPVLDWYNYILSHCRESIHTCPHSKLLGSERVSQLAKSTPDFNIRLHGRAAYSIELPLYRVQQATKIDKGRGKGSCKKKLWLSPRGVEKPS